MVPKTGGVLNFNPQYPTAGSVAQSDANWRNTHGSNTSTHTLASTQLQPRCAKRQLARLLQNLESNFILKMKRVILWDSEFRLFKWPWIYKWPWHISNYIYIHTKFRWEYVNASQDNGTLLSRCNLDNTFSLLHCMKIVYNKFIILKINGTHKKLYMLASTCVWKPSTIIMNFSGPCIANVYTL